MNEFFKVLLNIRSLRAACRELPLEQLQDALEKLTAVVEERQQEDDAERSAREEHQRKLQEYSNMLKEAGIDPSELISSAPAAPAKKGGKRDPRPPKYRYMSEDGVEKTWTGQGRMPSVLAKAVEEGRSLEEFAIEVESA